MMCVVIGPSSSGASAPPPGGGGGARCGSLHLGRNQLRIVPVHRDCATAQILLQQGPGVAEPEGMSSAPSVLLLDDGELDHVHDMLKRLGADYVRFQKREIRRAVEKPRDLLISSCQRTLEMPRLESTEDAPLDLVWVCVHNQDFLPLRQRLRELGVHFLVHTALDQESLRLFLLQLLRRDMNRRRQLRLPLGESVQWRAPGSGLEPAKLIEFSSDACRILSACAAEPETATSIFLPAALGRAEKLELQGRVVRCSECEPRSGGRAFSIVVQLDDLEPEARAQVERLVRGEQIGTHVTPLAERLPGDPEPQASEPQVPEVEAAEAQAAELPVRKAQAPEPCEKAHEPPAPTETAEDAERRRGPRWEYAGQVDILDFDDSDTAQTALGRDLSFRGVRIAGHSGMEVGSVVTLALYGGRREEPVVVEANVVRDDGEEGMGLTFGSATASQRRAIEKLIAGLPLVESLSDSDKERDGVVIARVTSAPQ